MTRTWIAPHEHPLADLLQQQLNPDPVQCSSVNDPFPDALPDATVLLWHFDPVLTRPGWLAHWINRAEELVAHLQSLPPARLIGVWPCVGWDPPEHPAREDDLITKPFRTEDDSRYLQPIVTALQNTHHSVDFVMIPPLIGPGVDTQLSWWQDWIQRSARGDTCVLPRTSNRPVTLAYSLDVVAGIKILLNRDTSGESFILGGQSITPEECARTATSIVGATTEPQLASPLAFMVRRWAGAAVPPAALCERLRRPLRYSSQKAIGSLDYTRTPIRMAIEKTLDSLGHSLSEPRSTLL